MINHFYYYYYYLLFIYFYFYFIFYFFIFLIGWFCFYYFYCMVLWKRDLAVIWKSIQPKTDMKKGRKREMGRFRNLPKLILAGEKKMFGVYRDEWRLGSKGEGSNHVGLTRKITGFLQTGEGFFSMLVKSTGPIGGTTDWLRERSLTEFWEKMRGGQRGREDIWSDQ